MTNKRDEFEEIIRENLYREADEIEEKVQRSGAEELSDGQKEEVRQKLKNRIDLYEKERIYAGLSEEDREALELGRKMRGKGVSGKERRGRKRWKWFVSAAAVLALACVYGTTSMGTGEKFASAIEQIVGERRILKINSGDENRVLDADKEENAYQEMKRIFGIDVVKLVRMKGMAFEDIDLDENMQIAKMRYKYKGENFWYIISAGYYDATFGFDADDEIIKKENVELGGTETEITVYKRRGSEEIKCTAHFTYQKLEYLLVTHVKNEELKKMLKNLYFF